MLSTTACWTGLSKAQKDIFEARLYSRIDKLEVEPFGKDLLSLISKTHNSTGFPYDEKTTVLSIRELVKELRTYFGYLTFKELEICFLKGYQNEYGQFFGLNNKTYLQWAKCYSQEDNRLKAIKAMEKAKKELEPKPIELTEAEKDEIISKGALKCFETYKEAKNIFDVGNITYNLLVKKGLINFTKEVKLEIQAKAKEILKLRETGKLQDPTMIGNHHLIRLSIKEIEEGKGEPLKIECKRLALKMYFDQLIEMDADLEI
jgi:hypothetical protein